MTMIADAFIRANTLLQQLASKLDTNEQILVQQLAAELTTIQQLVSTDRDDANQPQTSQAELDPQSGCYRFAHDPGYYCPHCFDQRQQRVAAQRINSRLRVCPNCRNSIKPAR